MKFSNRKNAKSTKLYEYVVDCTPSKYLYKDKSDCKKDAEKHWTTYKTKEMPHLNHIKYNDAVKDGIVWFSSKKVK
jgi:hypothetical protein